LLFNLALQCAARKVSQNQKRLKEEAQNHDLVFHDDADEFSENMNNISLN
jgi:hypothetical protein